MSDTPSPPTQGYFYYPPGDMSIRVPSSNCTIINSTSGCHILVHDGDTTDADAQPDIQVHHSDINDSTRRRERRRDRPSRTTSDTSHTRRGPVINTVNSFNNVYVGQEIVNNRTVDSDGVVDESRMAYEDGEAPAPSRRSKRHRSKRQRSRNVDDEPVSTYTMRPTGSGTILEVGEDVDYSGRGSSGGVSVPDLGAEAQTDGPPSYYTLYGEVQVPSSFNDEGASE